MAGNNTVRGAIEIKQNIAEQMRLAQTSTQTYIKTVKSLDQELRALERAKVKTGDLDMSDVRQAQTEMDRLKQAVRAISGTTGSVEIQADTAQAETEISNFKGKVAGLVATIGITAVVKNAVTTGIDYNAMIEQSKTAWTTLLGDAQTATDQIAAVQQLAAATPYEFAGLDAVAKKLSMAGFAGDALREAMVNVGDAVSAIGGGQAELEGVSTALYQIYSKGKLSAEEMLQLAERGIPAWEILAGKLGVSTAELQEMTTAGEMMANEVLPLLVEGMGERFAGAMEAQSKTFNGMVSTLKDNLTQLSGQATEGMFDGMKGAIQDVMGEMDRLSETGELQSAMRSVGSALGTVVNVGAGVVKMLWDMRGAVAAAAVGFGAYKAVMLAQNGWKAVTGIYHGVQVALTAVRTAQQASTMATTAQTLAQAKNTVAGVAATASEAARAAATGASTGAVTLNTGAVVTNTAATNAATVATKLLAAAQAATPWGIIALAIGGVVAGFSALQNATAEINRPLTETREHLKEIETAYADAQNAARDSFDNQMADVATMQQEIESLDKLISQGASGRELDLAVDDLLERFPELEGAIENVNGKWEIQRDKVNEVVEAVKREIAAELARDELKAAMTQERDAQAELEKAQSNKEEYLAAHGQEWNRWQTAVTQAAQAESKAQQLEAEYAYQYTHPGDMTDAEIGALEKSAKAAREEANAQATARDSYGQNFIPYEQAIAAAQNTLENAQAASAAATAKYEQSFGSAQPQTEAEAAKASAYTADIMAKLESDLRPTIDAANAAQAYINAGDVTYGLKYAQNNGMHISDEEIQKAGTDAAAAAKLLTEKLEEAAEETLVQTKKMADDQLAAYGSEMSEFEKAALQNYSSTISDALSASSRTAGDSMANAIGWLRSWTLPIDITIKQTDGGITYTSGTERKYTTTGIKRGFAHGTKFAQAGAAWVGEEGPELVELPQGAAVTPVHQAEHRAQELAAQSTAPNITININRVDARDDRDVDDVVDRIVDALERTL